MKLSVSHNFPEIQAALNQLDADIRQRASVSAINKTVDQAKTKMAQSITAEFALPSAYVKDRLKGVGASFKGGMLNIGARLVGGDGRRRSANIIGFVEKKTTMAQARRRSKDGTLHQLYVKVKKTGPAKPLPGAFIGNKGRTVFERVGDARTPIRPVQVIDVPQMFNTKRINASVLEVINTKFPEIFQHEVSYFTQRFMSGKR